MKDMVIVDNEMGVHTSLPDFCRDIKAAWEIVGHLTGIKEKCLQLNIDGVNNECALWIGNKREREVFKIADTVPMAICLAFLKMEDK